jgi:hypothetical protein
MVQSPRQNYKIEIFCKCATSLCGIFTKVLLWYKKGFCNIFAKEDKKDTYYTLATIGVLLQMLIISQMLGTSISTMAIATTTISQIVIMSGVLGVDSDK